MRIAVQTRSLQECVRRCYEYIFCYSVTFDITQQRPCIFYLHASDHCSERQLVPVDSLNQDGPVTIECLKCMSAEEAANIGTFRSRKTWVLESTSVGPKSTTKKFEGPAEIEFSHDEEAKQQEIVKSTPSSISKAKTKIVEKTNFSPEP